ncbi:DUF2865 domain-containing protein [Bosea caraganae]|nr:DUF2865 domain-containing protein [Bosea caraganae]
MLLAFAAMSGAAFAQSPACNAWRSELAGLQGQRSGDPRSAQQAQRVGAQLSQLAGQFRSMGCERGGFLFFGEQPPAQCGGIRAQMNQLQAQYQALQRQAQGGGVEQRRAQLAAAIENNCRAEPQRRGFFETIFGTEPRRPPEVDSTLPELDPDQQQQPTEEKARMGGPYTVCVRTCDGFFFPLANSPGGSGGQDEMCQALCPGVETSAFGMSSGGDIQNAVQRSTGTPYSSLPNAGKYTRSFDAACTCKTQGQSWVQVLRNAEDLLDKRKGDIIVTEQRSLEMSRPKADPKADARRKGQAPAPVPTSVAADPSDEPMPSLNSPTSGTESAGMGPQAVEPDKTLQQGDGLKKETKSVTGERRTVRIVAPNLAPNLAPTTARP